MPFGTHAGIFFILVMLIAPLIVNSLDFSSRNSCPHSDQFILWQGNTVPKAANTPHTTSVTLPTAYDSTYDRQLALAGLSFNIRSTVEFQMFLEPYSSDLNAAVSVFSGADTYFYELSVYIVFAKSSSNWVWLINGSK